jgi:hypothetical protein
MDVVVCAAGLLYMPVAAALGAWARVLNPDGVIAFSTMRSGSPASGRIFRACAQRNGWHIPDPSEALGSPSRCRDALEQAGFHRVQIVSGRVDFERLDPTLAWEANIRAAAQVVPGLTPHAQDAVRTQFLEALRLEMEVDPAAASRADVLFAVARRPPP